MTDSAAAESAWFAAVDADDLEDLDSLDTVDTDARNSTAVTAIRDGTAATPDNWPALAVEIGIVDDENEYYDLLHTATMAATRATVTEREAADDRQLVHAVRAMDDCERTANELAERLAEWAGTVDPDAGTGISFARKITAGEHALESGHEPIASLAERVVDLADEADDLREFVERQTPTVAPNLAALAGPVLGARLLSLAGELESLAKKPSGTIQVLGAEDALFAHLRGHASSPKHGIIYMHDAVRGTHPDERGSAARAVAGKLAIAARVDHYSGERKPELEAELAERIETIQARTTEGDDNGDDNDDAGTDAENGGETDA
ncbi:rRNA/tRNA 2'-O-methyltransferase complex protein Nop5 [Natrialba magadii ATCC 43099]|uniref:Pre-mRNA processing ribonucleoprotein, binding domain-containing protein n=1 Tax=Natrialba magadii (strain ATCC 43099 / DSM 3394 / CCM 3739 / CIP 104546 / IAM 13178 / JCM 8861 / NBRC 102185 / NCIMB 2190 / MS3) TaxID=547559 RepID=D3SZE4_NATMM|nr:NOP5/NOP56 family protein [Natrialba magadii]ADD04278.1 rRNA/tRNA 2'-O-methyltransferase complex protein Nop5 [Natrialba magadii ATCC 43099]ELY26680.1 Pre-mRNA processing ribonucleoprotein, binding domain-containing protein [Natrialba magadii ATCC 43099]